MSPHIPDVSLPPAPGISIEDQHQLSGELVGCSEHSSRADQTQEEAVQGTADEKPDSMDVQEPAEPDLDLISEKLPPQVPTKPLVTISTWENALLNSQTAARLQPHLPPYELSFWTDACLRGPKPVKLEGCGLCVVHRRLDNSSPDDRDFAIIWWQDSFVARDIRDIGRAEMMAVGQALEITVEQCERISGIAVTKAKIKKPGAAEELKRRVATVPWPMPKVVNVFTDSQPVLDTITCCWYSDSGWPPASRSPLRRVNTTIEALMTLGVRVHLQWVPGHASDVRNRWAHEGARNALKPQYQSRKVYQRSVHRVHRRPQKDRFASRTFTARVERKGSLR